MHRVAPDDLSETLFQKKGYFTISLPLNAVKPEKFNRHGSILMTRHPGQLLHLGRWNEQQVERLKSEISPHAFQSQYQQKPTLGGSGFCTIERLARYGQVPAFELKIHSWCIGATVSGNPSVCTKWDVARDKTGHDILYLTNVIWLKRELPDVRAAIKAHDKLDKPELIILDHRGVGLGIYQEFQKEQWPHVMEAGSDVSSNDSKIDRFTTALIPMYDGIVRFPK